MSANVAKLKKQAAELEQKRQLDKALTKYIQILGALDDQHLDESDIALFNRVGDLLMRQGKVAEAVDYYEKAVDHYTDGGFFNNAIALCNKILRNAPGRTSVYYKLGRISAKKGFVADAKQSFLEYADRMQQAGRMDDAFRALAELADLCPDQEDIRLILAEQLAKSDRRGEAIEQLQRLHEKMDSEGRTREARATLERMRAIDPDVAPRTPSSTAATKSKDLVFLDVNYDAPDARHASTRHADPVRAPAADVPRAAPRDVGAAPREHEHIDAVPHDMTAGLDDTPSDGDLRVERVAVEGFEATDLDIEATPLDGLEQTAMTVEDAPDQVDVPGLSHSMLDGMRITADAPVSAVEVDEAFAVVEPMYPEADDGQPVNRHPAGGSDDESNAGEMADREAVQGHEAAVGTSTSAERPIGLEILNEQALDVDEDAAAAIGIAPGDRSPVGADSVAVTEDDALELLDSSTSDERISSSGDASALDDDGVDALIEIDLDDDAVAFRGDDAGSIRHELAFLELDDFTGEHALDAERSDRAEAGLDEDEPIGGALPLIDLEPESATAIDFEPPAPWAPHERETLDAEGVASDADRLEIVSSDDAGAWLDPLGRLREAAEAAPDDGQGWQRLGEALLEAGDRDGGVAALEEAVAAYERVHDFAHGRSVIEEILRLEPNSIRHHQKRVELVFRIGDRSRLVDAYLELADCLYRGGEVEKCRAVLARVNELAPEDRRALDSMRAIDPTMVTPVDEVPAIAPQDAAALEETDAPEAPVDGVASAPSSARDAAAGFVDLAAWLAEDSVEKSTRMVADVAEPQKESDVDFQRMLDMFKQGVAQNVEETDHESHYDLGVAYKEMGLLDEAIAEFQKALRGTENRVRTYEALGQCFMEKRQYQVALAILSRAVADRRYGDEVLVGVLYLLGSAHESLGQSDEARSYYERVIAVDIGFRDVTDRLAAVEGAG